MARLLSSRPLHALFGKGSAPAERSIALPPHELQPNNTQLSKNWKALIQMITRLTGRGSVLEIRSVQERKWLIEQTWQQIWHHPLLGTGAGTFPLTLREILPPGYRAEPVHHVGALIFAELGLPGFGFGLALFGAFLHEGRRRKDPEARAIAACLFGLLIASTLDHPLWTMAPMRALGGSLLGAWLGRQKSEDAGDQGPPASDEKKLEGPDSRQRPCRR
jgi:hypothetical protein